MSMENLYDNLVANKKGYNEWWLIIVRNLSELLLCTFTFHGDRFFLHFSPFKNVIISTGCLSCHGAAAAVCHHHPDTDHPADHPHPGCHTSLLLQLGATRAQARKGNGNFSLDLLFIWGPNDKDIMEWVFVNVCLYLDTAFIYLLSATFQKQCQPEK